MPDIALVAPIVSALVTLLLIAWMLRARDQVPLDVPNDRSLHSLPLPRSGGMAIMAGIFAGFAILQTPLVIVVPAAALVVVSHFDDILGLPIPVRLGAQLAAAAGFAFGAFPTVALTLLVILGILWMANLYNFMDGSDGLAGGMAVIGFASLAGGAWMSGNDASAIECAIMPGPAPGFDAARQTWTRAGDRPWRRGRPRGRDDRRESRRRRGDPRAGRGRRYP